MNFAVARCCDRDAVMRMLGAGAAWGLALTTGLFALDTLQCGLPCPADVAATTGISVAAGILTIGPIAAFHSRR